MSRIRRLVARIRLRLGLDRLCENCAVLMTSWERKELGFCGNCVAGALLEAHRPKYLRMIAKRRRYLAAGARTANLDEQLLREIFRMQKRVTGLRPEMEPAIKRVVTSWFATA